MERGEWNGIWGWVTKGVKEDITNKWEGYKRKREEREGEGVL